MLIKLIDFCIENNGGKKTCIQLKAVTEIAGEERAIIYFNEYCNI